LAKLFLFCLFFFFFGFLSWIFLVKYSHGWSPVEQDHKIGRRETLVGVCHLN
jgi:hypothetical protein